MNKIRIRIGRFLSVAAALAVTTTSSAAFISLELFEDLNVGETLNSSAAWNGNDHFTVQLDPLTGSNAVRIPKAGDIPSVAPISFDLGSYAVANQSVATLFYTFSMESGITNSRINAAVGFARGPDPVADFGDQGAYAIHKGSSMTARNGPGDAPESPGFQMGVNYNVWLVLDNKAGTADTYDLWVQGGTGAYADQTQLYSDLAVRTGSDGAYSTLYLYAFLNNGAEGDLYLDNFHIDPTGENLSVIPEPGTYAAFFGLFSLVGVMLRRRFRQA